MKVRGHRKLKGTPKNFVEKKIFLFNKILRGTFLQIIVEFGEINVRNKTSENTREVDTKPPKILVECNGYAEMFSLSGAVEIFGRYLLIRTDILQKTVDGCPCELLLSSRSNALRTKHIHCVRCSREYTAKVPTLCERRIFLSSWARFIYSVPAGPLATSSLARPLRDLNNGRFAA